MLAVSIMLQPGILLSPGTCNSFCRFGLSEWSLAVAELLLSMGTRQDAQSVMQQGSELSGVSLGVRIRRRQLRMALDNPGFACLFLLKMSNSSYAVFCGMVVKDALPLF